MSEADTRRAIEIYRREHETWNVEPLMALFADDAVWKPAGQPPAVGREAVRAYIEQRAANPVRRRMIHLCEIIDGNYAAVEWEVHHLGDDGNWHPYRFGYLRSSGRQDQVAPGIRLCCPTGIGGLGLE